jgi:hypothetical protein
MDWHLRHNCTLRPHFTDPPLERGGIVSVCCNDTTDRASQGVAGGNTAGQAVPAGNSIKGWATKVLVV